KRRRSEGWTLWNVVAHPALGPIAKDSFDSKMPQGNQIDRKRDEVRVTASDLLQIQEGPITEQGIRQNVNVGIQYVEAWLGGLGCVPLFNLMEDAATAEISRTQLWQWIHHGAITRKRYEQIRDEELKKIGDRPNLE